jgi:hypothetical protein
MKGFYVSRRLGVLALVLVCAGLAVSAAGASAATRSGSTVKTMHFLDLTTSFGESGAQNQMPKAGDRFWFHDEVYTWQGAHRGAHVGHVNIVATVVAPNVAYITAVATLPGGTLSISGENNFAATGDRLAIVGGTGAYAGARGELITRDIGNPETSNKTDITIRLSA